MNCPNCKKEVKDNSKFCPHCGMQIAGVNSGNVSQTSILPINPNIESGDTTKKTQMQPMNNTSGIGAMPSKSIHSSSSTIGAGPVPKNKGSNATLLKIVGVLAVVLIGGGILFISNDKDSTQTNNVVATTNHSSDKDNKIESKQSVVKDDSLDDDKKRLEAASSIVRKMGFDQLVTSTSYGNSTYGFMAIVGGSVMIFDTDNNRAATIWGVGPLMKFKRQVENHETGPVIVNFAVWNDTQDKDVRAGWWEGNRHHIPIYMLWRYENGKIVDDGLYTARGQNASHYHEYLYEQKNCDLAFLFYTEAIPLIKDANKHGALKTKVN